MEHIIYELENNGIVFDDGNSYTPYQIEQTMQALFGNEAAALIIEKVMAELNNLDNNHP